MYQERINRQMKPKIDIRKGFYNKTRTQDGINHIIDTQNEYIYYEVSICNAYFNVENEQELKKAICNDLRTIIKALEKEKEMDKNEEQQEI